MRKKRILIVGDEQISNDKIKQVLEDTTREVSFTSIFSNVIDRIHMDKVDLLILNVNMSLLDEISLVKEIRSNYLMDLLPILIVNSNADIWQKIEFLSYGADDYLYYPFNEKELFFRTINLLKRVDRNRDVNPLSGLSGNMEIQNQITDNIELKRDFAVLYCDLDNFKVYNDVYGFASGDKVIKKVAEVLSDTIKNVGTSDDFIGHIGGDDFVVITTPDRADKIGQMITESFDNEILSFYNPEDRNKGYITSKDREGNVKDFPIMSISVAAVTTDTRRLICAPQVAEIAARVKKDAKSIKGSSYVKDKRDA